MRGCCAVIYGAFAPAVSTSTLPVRSRSIVKLTSKSFFQCQRHSQVRSASLSLRKRLLKNGSREVSAQCSRYEEEEELSEDDFVVVNFYRFVFIKDPEAEVARHLSFLQVLDIHGRIYLNEQGINAQYSGPSKDAVLYVRWLREDDRFSDILVQISPAQNGHAFPKLKLRYKPSLVQLEGGISHLPLLDPSVRATPLAPSEWRKRLESAGRSDDASNLNRNYVLLDVRNGYEWDIGHFSGVQRPSVDCFRSTSFGQSQKEDVASDPLASVDKQKTDILMYCTGGIRCDVYSTILRCYICGSQVSELRHRNCANLDCNLLFLCCTDCLEDLNGCCCGNCISAPRLRPVLPGHQRYTKWHTYRDLECKAS